MRYLFFTVALFGAGAGIASAQASSPVLPPDPVVGTWTLNLAKSKYAIPAPKRMVITITPAARGYTFAFDVIGPDGQPQQWGYASAFDGSESPVTGNPSVDTVVATSTGSGTTVRYKKAGTVITTTSSELSDDGKTFVVTIRVPDGKGSEIISTAVYEKTSNPQAVSWPRFRGPDSNPISDNPHLPVKWSKTENVEWVADVPGVGWSSPVVWGTRVFLTAATSEQKMKPPSLGTEFSNEYIAELRKQGLSADEINKRLWARDREMPEDIVISLVLLCYDLESGKRLWERQIYHGRPRGGRHVKNSFASETPVTDGERVYAYFTDYGLYAFDFDGTPVWATPFERRETIRDYGTGASPALYRDRLFVLNDNEEQSFLAAFDTKTGKEVWRTPRTVKPVRKTGWSTPFVWENRLRTEVVTLGPAVVISYGLDGRELWRMNRMGAVAIQSPFAWNGILFVTSGTSGDSDKPVAAIRAGAAGDITPQEPANKNEHVVWYDRIAGGTYLPTPVLYKNALYVLYDKGIISRYNPQTGERVFRSRIAPGAAAFTASPWAYNGKIFLLSEEGNTFVMEAGEEYRLLGVNALDEFSLATPAIVGDRLLIRTQSHLYSIRNRR